MSSRQPEEQGEGWEEEEGGGEGGGHRRGGGGATEADVAVALGRM